MDNLTTKQKDFFYLLKKNYGRNALPSLENIRAASNFRSRNSVAQYINVFKKLNLLEERSGRTYIANKGSGAILFDSKVRAGFASVMDDAIDKLVSFDEELNLNSPSVFIFKVSGDSMVDLGIFEGDYVSIKKTSDAKDGDVVLANVDGGFTLKTFRKQGGRVWLQPANPSYPDIIPKNTLTVFGIATGVVRKL